MTEVYYFGAWGSLGHALWAPGGRLTMRMRPAPVSRCR